MSFLSKIMYLAAQPSLPGISLSLDEKGLEEDLKNIPIPRYRYDIVDWERLHQFKNLFSRNCNSPSPLMSFDLAGDGSLECYLADKTYSSVLRTETIQSIANRVKTVFSAHLNHDEYKPDILEKILLKHDYESKSGYILEVISSYPLSIAQKDDPYYRKKIVENAPETFFISRIINRLQKEAQNQVTKEIFSKKDETLSRLKEALLPEREDNFKNITWSIENRCWAHEASEYTKNLTDTQVKAYEQFCTEFYDRIDQKVFDLFQKKLDLDLIAREENPNVPLIHLATETQYEYSLRKKRALQLMKIMGIVFTPLGIIWLSYHLISACKKAPLRNIVRVNREAACNLFERVRISTQSLLVPVRRAEYQRT